eukprot:7391676-Prymnesium_polylepis.2
MVPRSTRGGYADARGCGAWAVWLCESIRLGEGRSRPGLRVLRETAFNKVKLSQEPRPLPHRVV